MIVPVPLYTAVGLVMVLLAAAATADVLKTTEESEAGSVRITSPADGDSLPGGEPLEVTYEATLGFKGRYVQLELDGESVVLEKAEGSHTFSGAEPGEHTIRAALLNRAHADLGIEDSITVTVGKE